MKSAIEAIGFDFDFPHKINGMPSKLSDFDDLQVGTFETNDGVSLSYWAAGQGIPVIFVPSWSSSGAEYLNLLWMMRNGFRCYVLEMRNHGLSEKTLKGPRIARLAMDLHEFMEHIGIGKTSLCGHSLGASVIWSYIDLFGTARVEKAVFVDQPISIYAHSDWSEETRKNAGSLATSAEALVGAICHGKQVHKYLVNDAKLLERLGMMDSPYAQNMQAFASAVATNDGYYLGQIMFDHATNDWRDVIQLKLDIPVAVFSGTQSDNLPSQAWLAETAQNGRLYSYSDADEGDHFLMLKNPVKFAEDVMAFLTDQ